MSENKLDYLTIKKFLQHLLNMCEMVKNDVVVENVEIEAIQNEIRHFQTLVMANDKISDSFKSKIRGIHLDLSIKQEKELLTNSCVFCCRHQKRRWRKIKIEDLVLLYWHKIYKTLSIFWTKNKYLGLGSRNNCRYYRLELIDLDNAESKATYGTNSSRFRASGCCARLTRALTWKTTCSALWPLSGFSGFQVRRKNVMRLSKIQVQIESKVSIKFIDTRYVSRYIELWLSRLNIRAWESFSRKATLPK